jgi:hypothetical protein
MQMVCTRDATGWGRMDARSGETKGGVSLPFDSGVDMVCPLGWNVVVSQQSQESVAPFRLQPDIKNPAVQKTSQTARLLPPAFFRPKERKKEHLRLASHLRARQGTYEWEIRKNRQGGVKQALIPATPTINRSILAKFLKNVKRKGKNNRLFLKRRRSRIKTRIEIYRKSNPGDRVREKDLSGTGSNRVEQFSVLDGSRFLRGTFI